MSGPDAAASSGVPRLQGVSIWLGGRRRRRARAGRAVVRPHAAREPFDSILVARDAEARHGGRRNHAVNEREVLDRQVLAQSRVRELLGRKLDERTVAGADRVVRRLRLPPSPGIEVNQRVATPIGVQSARPITAGPYCPAPTQPIHRRMLVRDLRPGAVGTLWSATLSSADRRGSHPVSVRTRWAGSSRAVPGSVAKSRFK